MNFAFFGCQSFKRKKERIYFSKVIIKHQNRYSIKIINSERIDKRHIERPLIVYPVYINNSGYLNKIMIKIKYIFDLLIFSLKRRYFGYKKTIVLGGSPSIEALSPLLEDIYNCGKKNNKKQNKKNKKKQKKTEKKTKTKTETKKQKKNSDISKTTRNWRLIFLGYIRCSYMVVV